MKMMIYWTVITVFMRSLWEDKVFSHVCLSFCLFTGSEQVHVMGATHVVKGGPYVMVGSYDHKHLSMIVTSYPLLELSNPKRGDFQINSRRLIICCFHRSYSNNFQETKDRKLQIGFVDDPKQSVTTEVVSSYFIKQ